MIKEPSTSWLHLEGRRRSCVCVIVPVSGRRSSQTPARLPSSNTVFRFRSIAMPRLLFYIVHLMLTLAIALSPFHSKAYLYRQPPADWCFCVARVIRLLVTSAHVSVQRCLVSLPDRVRRATAWDAAFGVDYAVSPAPPFVLLAHLTLEVVEPVI